MRFADVVVFDVGDPWSPTLTYEVGDLELARGSVVRVVWGRKEVVGVVVSLHDQVPEFKTKPVVSKLYELPISNHLIDAASWMAEYYHEPLQRCFETVVLCKKAITRKTAIKKLNAPSKQVVETLMLTQKQQSAVDQVLANKSYATFLLHGVTGSGKTEVYLTIMGEVLKQGRSALYLIPEIGLTPQTLGRIRARFGDTVRVVNSTLSDGERFRLMGDVQSGACKIVVGSRSALFAPLADLGLIVIDECHDDSYNQDNSPHYNTVKVAERICMELQIPLVLGSATPTLEQYFQIQNGQSNYQLISLPTRANEAVLPTVKIADMREELKQRNFTTISSQLEQALKQSLAAGEQAVLFMNRRGYAGAFVCRACGWRASCPSCSVALVYHRAYGEQRQVLACHQCEHVSSMPTACGACGSTLVKPFGSGTERVVDEVQKLFPKARVVRMDKDTTSKKGSHAQIYEAFASGSFDILVGTQMVTKGWDIAGVTCVGIVNADSMLHMPMYNAAERAFALMMQVAGRAGRTKEQAGTVVIQTYSPDHYAVVAAAAHSYDGFYKQELEFRKMLSYPPFSCLAQLTFAHKKQEEADKRAKLVREMILDKLTVINKSDTIEGYCEVLGPREAPIHRIKEVYYFQIILKGSKGIIDQLLEVVPKDWSVNVDI